nr:acetyl-CoA carboxylase biotin carboxylase subunit [uncultured Acetobacter sp.]
MSEFRRVLIANRGEIALRIARACRLLGLEAVGIYSEADAGLPHLRLMAQSVCIGPTPASASYLDSPRILRAAKFLGADAIHPGYGFLSENANFADAVVEAGLVFIGPSAPIMREMGDKIAARCHMMRSGVPCLPGTEGALPQGQGDVEKIAARIGYPVIIKAAAGGGGRGMRVVPEPGALSAAVEAAREEARRAFGNSAIYMERFLSHPRHIEIQIIADTQGNAVWLGARDCSVQRRHQKLIEEAPVIGINPLIIAQLGERCAHACREMGYVGAGTFEFLYENESFFFIEMNTRLQVEHPVTEMTTGIDIVETQLRVALGQPLPFTQADVRTNGHAIECRITAEDPETFIPSPGLIHRWRPPGGPGVRVDTHLYDHYLVPPHYDSLLAKIIVHGRNREDALARMRAALSETQVDGISTTLSLHARLMNDPAITNGCVDVHHLERILGVRDV